MWLTTYVYWYCTRRDSHTSTRACALSFIAVHQASANVGMPWSRDVYMWKHAHAYTHTYTHTSHTNILYFLKIIHLLKNVGVKLHATIHRAESDWRILQNFLLSGTELGQNCDSVFVGRRIFHWKTYKAQKWMNSTVICDFKSHSNCTGYFWLWMYEAD